MPKTGDCIWVGSAANDSAMKKLIGQSAPAEPESYVVRVANDGGRRIGIVAGADPRGRSLRPIAEGREVDDWRETLGVESEIGRMVVGDKCKYIKYDAAGAEEQLLDLKTDPRELRNIYNNPDSAPIVARLKAETQKSAGKGKRVQVFKVEKVGAGQIVLLGAPNTGKSQLVAATTQARVTVAEYPFTTTLPQPGMALYEDVQIQVVDTPPVTHDYMELWMPDTVRRGDAPYVIAQRYGVSLSSLLAANGLTRSSRIYPGDVLVVPGAVASQGTTIYTVRRGDTPADIAQSHGVSLENLLDVNGLTRRSVIYPGDQLTIPGR